MTRIIETDRPICSAIPGLRPVLAYWHGLRRGRVVPARADLDADAMQPWLPGAGLIERRADGRLRLRLGGRVFRDLLGVEARGMPFRAIFAPDMRAQVQILTEAVFDGPQILTLGLARSGACAPVSGAMAVLPLTDGAGGITRALIHVTLDPAPCPDQPCRLRITHAERTSLARSAPHDTPPPPSPQPPALRLIAGGRG